MALLGGAEAINLHSYSEISNQEKLYKILENKDDFSGWMPHMHEFPGTVNENGNYMQPYERVIPTVLDGDAANDGQVPIDMFTRNLVEKFAIEGIDKDADDKAKLPAATGKFYLTKAKGRELAAETICTHFSKCGADGEAYLNDKYEAAFKYYDVNGDGRIDAIGMGA